MTLALPEPSAAAVPLAPGFRFHPTDEELVSYYLRRRVLGRRLRIDAIAEVDLYRLEPWDLPSLSRIRSRDAQWYFFAHLDRKIAGAGAGGRGGPGNRTNRATPRGYWKTTGKDREVYHRSKLVGMKKTLVFHSGRAPKGQRTNWVMHEYRLLDADGVQDLHVVCRIFQKFGSGPQNGAQYGAPYVEEEWEEDDDDPIENTPASGATTEMALVTDTAEEELDEADENVSSNANELAQVQEVLSQPELAPLQGEASNGTGDGSYGEGFISLEEILQEPVSNIRAESFVKPEEQSGFDDKFSITDLCGYPAQDDGYAGQDGPMRWNDPSNDDYKYWPLKTYSNQNNACGALTAEEFFDTGNGTNACSGSQDMYLQRNGSSSSQQVDDNLVFYDAPSNHWVNGKDDCVHVNDLYQPVGNEFLFDAGDDLMAYFDATEDDIKFDILGSVEGSDSQIPDMSNFAQKGDDINGFTDDVIFESSDANALYGASSSGSHDNLHPYPGTAAPDAPMDDSVDKSFGKHLASMLGSIPAPPAMASEFPPALGKSVGTLSAVSPHSSFRVTAGIIQLGGLTFTGSSEHWPLQKNGDFSLLLSFTVEEDASTKSIGYEPAEPAQRMSPIPVVLRSGFYLFFVSAMILVLSYKVGLCIYSR